MAKAKTSRVGPGYNELKAELRQGQCRDLYVLTGEETFLIDRLLDGLADLLIAPGSQDLDRVVYRGNGQAGRIDPHKVLAEVRTPPFLSRRRLVIVRQSGWLAGSRTGRRADDAAESGDEETEGETDDARDGQNATALKDRQALLIRLFEHVPESACLVLVEQTVDRRQKALLAAIEQRGVLAEFARAQTRTLIAWVESECKKHELSIESAAAASLIDRCDGSMAVIRQELDKIFLYCVHAGVTAISEHLVADLSLPDLRGSIFDLTDALSAGEAGRALILADTLISQKQPVQLIQFMLTRHLRQLICAAELGRPDVIAAELKVLPFVASRLAGQARKLSPEQLEALYAGCFEMDVAIKSGRIQDRLALELLLVSTARQLRPASQR
jgi:DNA polymerase-3 subunit delta